MNLRTAACVETVFEPFVKRKAEIVECDAVRINALVVGAADSDELWCEVEDLPKLFLAFAQCLLGLHALFDVEIDANPIKQGSVVVPKGLCSGYEPSVSSLSVDRSEIHFARAFRFEAVRPDSARLITIIRMQKRDMGVP